MPVKLEATLHAQRKDPFISICGRDSADWLVQSMVPLKSPFLAARNLFPCVNFLAPSEEFGGADALVRGRPPIVVFLPTAALKSVLNDACVFFAAHANRYLVTAPSWPYSW